ncbi:MAG: threonine--tRNA ligase [Spirochaetes bacterium]|nr:threonine--tRNA ligase [Spirochaetota bacterium]
MPLISKEKKVSEDLQKKRHSLAHIMAYAVKKYFKDSKIKLGIGPAIENGFYYDFDIENPISEKDLKEISKIIKKLLSSNIKFEKKIFNIDEAKEIFRKDQEIYKLELLEELEKEGEKEVSIYYSGEFYDLCKGPHVLETKEINIDGFLLDRVSGAYWKGDEKNKMMQRIYGIYFDKKEELDEFLRKREEAKNKDHRNIGKEMKLFMISDIIGKGLPLLLPRGATLRRILERFTIDEELKRGYLHVYTPVLGSIELYKISGHLDHYKDSMYSPLDIDGELFILRPMTCPHHFIMYKNEIHSYKELPIRYAEISPLYRYEKSGELTGLIRLRNFTLADAHIILRKDQIKEEMYKVIDLIKFMMDTLGISSKAWYRASLGDRENKEKYIDAPELWEEAEKIILEICEELDLPYTVEKGEAAFYGPKIDVQLTNVYGKEDTAFTVQIDFALAERFDLFYIDSDGSKKRPIIIHRSSIGCFERTMAFLIEHYEGKFPIWLAPEQIILIPVSDIHNNYIMSIYEKFKSSGIRVNIDLRGESLSKKIREARLERYPYIGIAGDNEISKNTITIRNRDTGEQKEYKVEEVIETILMEDKNKSLKLSL